MTSEGQYAGTQPAEATSGGPTSDGFPPDTDGRRASGRATAQPPADGFPSTYAPPPPATPNGGSPFVVPAVSSFGQGSESAGSRPAGTSYGSVRVPQPEESDHGAPASPYGSVSPFAPPSFPPPSFPPPMNGSEPANGSAPSAGADDPRSAWAPAPAPRSSESESPFGRSDSGLPRRSPAAAPGDPLPQRNPTTPPELTEFDGFAAGNPGRGLAGDPPPAPSRTPLDRATGRPPGISAFGDQRVRVPGASLNDLPDAPAPGRGGFPAAPDENGPASGGFPLRGGGGAFPTRRGDSGGFPLRSPGGTEGDAPGGDLPIRSQQSPFGAPVDEAPHPYDRASAPEADAPFGRAQFGEPVAGPFARPGDQSADAGASAPPFGSARPTSYGSAAVAGNPPFGTDQSDSPFRAARSESPFPGDQSNSPFEADQSGGDQSGPPFGASQPGSPFGAGQSGSPFGAGQSGSPFGADQSGSPFGADQADSPFAPAAGAGGGTPYGNAPAAEDSPFGGARSGGEPRFGDAQAAGDAPFGTPYGRPESEPPAEAPFGNARPSSGSAYGSARPGSTYGSAQPSSAQPGGNSPYDGAPPGSGSPFRSSDPNSPYGAPNNAPAFGSPENAPAFGGAESAPAFAGPENAPAFGRAEDGAAFAGSEEGSRYGVLDNGSRFGNPEQPDDHALYRRSDSPSGESSPSGYPRRVPGAALGAVGLPDASGSPISLPGSPFTAADSPSALPGSPPVAPVSPSTPLSALPGPFGAAPAGDPRNGPVPQPRDPAERSAPAVGSARPVTASASVPSASRSAPVDPSELPPPPAAPQARVYGRPAAEPAPDAEEAPTPEPEQASSPDSPFRPPTPYGRPPFGDRPDDDRRTPGAFGSPAFPAPLSLPGSPQPFPGNDQNGSSAYPGQPGGDQSGPPAFGSPAYPGRPADADPARASARASASARVAPPGPQPIGQDRPGTPPFSEPTTDVAGRGRAPEQYAEHTTDIAGRGGPYVPAPALPTFPPPGQPLEERAPMGGLFPGPANRATVTPPTPAETTSWPGVEASDQNRFEQFRPEAEAAPAPVKAETPHVRMLPILLAVVVGAALLVGLAFGIVYLVAGGDSGSSSNAGFTVNTGDCVKKSGTAAVKADCSEASSFQVVSIVDDKSKCADPQQPYVLNPTSDGKTQVLCLKPNN